MPPQADLIGVFRVFITEYMGMAAHHFLVNQTGGIFDCEVAGFFKKAGNEKNLEKNIPEFFTNGLGVARFYGVDQFKHLFHQVN